MIDEVNSSIYIQEEKSKGYVLIVTHISNIIDEKNVHCMDNTGRHVRNENYYAVLMCAVVTPRNNKFPDVGMMNQVKHSVNDSKTTKHFNSTGCVLGFGV